MPSSARLTGTLLAALLVAVAPAPAHGHEMTSVLVVRPAEGEELGYRPDITLLGDGAFTEPATFRLFVDELPVDAQGQVGQRGLFLDLRLGHRQLTRLQLSPLPDGEHELRIVYALDPDDPKPDVVRRFRTTGAPAGGGRTLEVLVLLAGLATVGTSIALRRLARVRQGQPGRQVGAGTSHP